MFTKLFALYPPAADAEMKLRAYIDETRDIAPLVISHALKRLVRKGGEFAPNVATIRRECASFLRERHRAAEGLDPHGGLDHSGGEVDTALAERWLQRAPEALPALLALPAGPSKPIEVPAPATECERAIAILDAEIARLQRGMRVPR